MNIKEHPLIYAIGTVVVISSGYFIFRKFKNQRKNQLNMNENLTIDELMKKYSIDFANSKTIQKIIPRCFKSEQDLENLTTNLYYRNKNSHLESLTKSLSKPIWDLLDRGGKRWRPILCMLIAELYGHNKQEVYDIAALCEIIHNGTLIVDDIEDSSYVRRNKQCVHLIYGQDISINAGNFMYFAPILYLLKNGKLTPSQKVKFSQIYIQQMTNLHIGQGWDILWHNFDQLEGNYPTQQDYLQMTAHKTGVLARLAAKLVCAYLNVSQKQIEVLSRFAESMGVAFQIQDDLLNLQAENFIATKGYNGQDIHEGKITLIVLHFLQNVQNDDQRNRFIQILRKKTDSKKQIQQAINILRSTGSLQYARNKMESIVQKVWKDIELHLPDNRTRKYLQQLSLFSIKRDK